MNRSCDVAGEWPFWLVSLRVFDASLGFPGEGPNPGERMSIVSANIGSIVTNPLWSSWDADVVCLQETRVGKNNARSTMKNFQTKGWTPCLGDLLPFCWHKGKSSQTPCGGTLVAAPDSLIQPFCVQQDHTGLFLKLFKTKRVAVAWCQVTQHRQALIISVYAQTGASQDTKVHEWNNSLFDDIFTFVAQFGQIPIIIAGDLQAPPLSYPVISNAINFQSWHDPIANTDEQGEVSRPLTFSNDGLFSGPGDSCTSIDAMLVNDTAFAALHSATVLEHFGRQHRPIQLVFEWPSLDQKGFVHFKTAAFDLSSMHGETSSGNDLPDWSRDFEANFTSATTSDAKWDIVNDFLQSSILAKGALWGDGPKKRAATPVFSHKTIAPKQLLSRCAATAKTSRLAKLVGRLQELFTRLSRWEGSGEDQFITRRTAIKAFWALRDLNAPVGWSNPAFPKLVEVHFAKRWAEQMLMTCDASIRLQRIQSWKKRIRESANSNCSYIFSHLRNKQQDEPPNLVVDDDNNVIFQPEAALAHRNSAWDSVFGVNTLCEHPLKMLEVVWPYIKDQHSKVELPPVTANDLHHIIQHRKTNAAPGLDGWRTCELKTFSISELEPVASFFQLVEQTDLPLPRALVCAKQVILNKPGPATPMNKRLITILPALLLAYTGSRFAQLHAWQRQVMPESVLGGIKGRHMASLYNDIRLHIDCAKLDQVTLVGIKLDKAKAFDRIIPSFAAALFLAFGLPQGLVNVFLKQYNGLHKHLSYRRWICPQSTHGANGVAQGCSLSLLAMNAYNKVWCHLLDHLPEVYVRAFIDDAYLWSKLEHCEYLQKALEVTKVWDQLVGQQLNEGKSSMWATSSKGRKLAKKFFPQLPIRLEVEVLGTMMYTSERDAFHFDDKRLRKVLDDTDNIAALPVSHKTRVFLIGSKILPQISFGAHISKIPQQALNSIQNAIARALWVGRPKWRSRQLLQAVLSQPHRTDPRIACAYNTILECIRMCHTLPSTFSMLLRTWKNDFGEHSLAAKLQGAATVLGMRIDHELNMSYCGSTPVSIRAVSTTDASKVLQNLARQACYQQAFGKKRKDLVPSSKIFDFQQTTFLLKRSPLQAESDGVLLRSRLESVLVGCTLTNDRLAGSGWTDSALCRFCCQEKEDMHHLVHDCEHLHNLVGSPIHHELGENFLLLGHIAHPKFVARRRLQFAFAADLELAETFDPMCLKRLWTDGSLVLGESFWLATATYAIVDEQVTIIKKGLISHWAISAYAAELWPVVIACVTASTKVVIFSDCLNVVVHAQHLFSGGFADPTWSCFEWWQALQNVVQLRLRETATPFWIEWIPAHKLEHIPDYLLSDELAALHNTTVEHIVCNRKCDLAAKELAQSLSPVTQDMFNQMSKAVDLHQRWLIALHARMPTTESSADSVHVAAEGNDVAPTPELCKMRFPHWHWGLPRKFFPWRPKIPKNLPSPPTWKASSEDWASICAFLSGLHWQVDGSQSFSFCELAVLYHQAGYQITGDQELCTFYDIYKLVRECILQLSRLANVDAVPGQFSSTKPRSCGRVLPQGCIDGAIPFHSDEARVKIASAFAKGAGRQIESWRLCICDF